MKHRLVTRNLLARAIALTLSLILSVALVLAQITQAPPAPKAYEDRGKLEELEDRSEDIANGILELAVAVRDVNTAKIAEFFAEGAKATPLPAEKTEAAPEVKWIQKHGWKFEPKTLVATNRTTMQNSGKHS